MLYEAVVEKGQVRFLQPVTFVHDYFTVKIDVPDREVLPQDKFFEVPVIDAVGNVAGEYPAEYLAFKKLQEAAFGKEYKYKPEKTDKEIMQEHWMKKYA